MPGIQHYLLSRKSEVAASSREVWVRRMTHTAARSGEIREGGEFRSNVIAGWGEVYLYMRDAGDSGWARSKSVE